MFQSSAVLNVTGHPQIGWYQFQWRKWSISKQEFGWIGLALKNVIFIFLIKKNHIRIISGEKKCLQEMPILCCW